MPTKPPAPPRRADRPGNGLRIVVRGAGIVGLWQALTLRRAGHDVTLLERSPASAPFAASASWYAGGMLAPFCEAEAASARVHDLGLASLPLWRAEYPALVTAGSLVLTAARDRAELDRYARMTTGHRLLDADGLAALEPALAGRFSRALHYPEEAHMCSREALAHLLARVRAEGVETCFGVREDAALPPADVVVDCRGIAAAGELPRLRGVRGEMIVVDAPDVQLSRPIRLLHPRFPLYVVPWGGPRYMIGATVIESAGAGPVTVRSALELLGAAYALHPAFAEAEILELGAGERPAFPDNVPAIAQRDGRIYVNGMFRHGFLSAPALAVEVAAMLAAKRGS